MNMIYGIDVSYDVEKITAQWAEQQIAAGKKVLVVDLWDGENIFAAESALWDWRQAGGIIGGYIAVRGQVSADFALMKAKESAGNEWDNLSFISLDVELNSILVSDIQALMDLLDQEGKRYCLYTSKGFWKDHFSNHPLFSRVPLWDARYDNTIELGNPNYGGWVARIGKQYQNNMNVDGVLCDLDVFSEEFIMNQQQQLPDIRAELDGLWAALDVTEREASDAGNTVLSQRMEDAKQNYIVSIKQKMRYQ